MLSVAVPQGALFYGKEQRREVVTMDEVLRRETEEVAAGVHWLLAEGRTPPPVYAKKCDSCSLVDLCLPRQVGGRGNRVTRYLERVMDEP
jgi:CRISPR-associated exonuclease Cas4